jgi:hypothetical protein
MRKFQLYQSSRVVRFNLPRIPGIFLLTADSIKLLWIVIEVPRALGPWRINNNIMDSSGETEDNTRERNKGIYYGCFHLDANRHTRLLC